MTRNPRRVPPAPSIEEILAAAPGERIGTVDFGPPTPPVEVPAQKTDPDSAERSADAADAERRPGLNEIMAALQSLTERRREP